MLLTKLARWKEKQSTNELEYTLVQLSVQSKSKLELGIRYSREDI